MRKSNMLIVVAFLVGVVTVGGLSAYVVSISNSIEGFSEFYLIGSKGQLADYPTNLSLGQNGSVTLGIVNNEGENVTYKIVISLEDNTIETLNNITLSNQMSWEEKYTFTPTQTGDNMRLKFELYRGTSDTIYRNLSLMVTVSPT